MKITLVTPTCDRPEAFELCEKWMARQTVSIHQWIVLDDGINPAKCTMGQVHMLFGEETRGKQSLARKIRYLMETPQAITGDAIAFIEDDDWYSPNYLQVAASRLGDYNQMIGEAYALYYNVRDMHWHMHTNDRHASLCQTVLKRSFFPELLKVVKNDLDPFIDVRLWGDTDPSLTRMIFIPDPKPTLVGIKGIYQGYGIGHSKRLPHYDDGGNKLSQLIGADAKEYRKFRPSGL